MKARVGGALAAVLLGGAVVLWLRRNRPAEKPYEPMKPPVFEQIEPPVAARRAVRWWVPVVALVVGSVLVFGSLALALRLPGPAPAPRVIVARAAEPPRAVEAGPVGLAEPLRLTGYNGDGLVLTVAGGEDVTTVPLGRETDYLVQVDNVGPTTMFLTPSSAVRLVTDAGRSYRPDGEWKDGYGFTMPAGQVANLSLEFDLPDKERPILLTIRTDLGQVQASGSWLTVMSRRPTS